MPIAEGHQEHLTSPAVGWLSSTAQGALDDLICDCCGADFGHCRPGLCSVHSDRVLCRAGHHDQEVHDRRQEADHHDCHPGRTCSVQDAPGSRKRHEDRQGVRVEVKSVSTTLEGFERALLFCCPLLLVLVVYAHNGNCRLHAAFVRSHSA